MNVYIEEAIKLNNIRIEELIKQLTMVESKVVTTLGLRALCVVEDGYLMFFKEYCRNLLDNLCDDTRIDAQNDTLADYYLFKEYHNRIKDLNEDDIPVFFDFVASHLEEEIRRLRKVNIALFKSEKYSDKDDPDGVIEV